MHGVVAVRVEALDRREGRAIDIAEDDLSGARRLAVDMHRAGPAEPDAAAIFRAGQPREITDAHKSGIAGS